jgi:hypothetical protein
VQIVRPNRHIFVQPEALQRGSVHVLHPCRCDAPDPEAARIEPLEVPLGPLLAEGRSLVTCRECDYLVLAVLAGAQTRHDDRTCGTNMCAEDNST